MLGRNRNNPLQDIFIDTASYQELAPEEILTDSFATGSGEVAADPQIEVPLSLAKIRLLFGSFFIILGILASYLSYMAIAQGEERTLIAQGNAQRVYKIGPSRGEIYDRDGTVLATSTPAFNLVANPSRFDDEGEAYAAASELHRHYPDLSQESIAAKLVAGYERNLGHTILLKNLDEQTVAALSSVIEAHDAFYLQETNIRSYPLGEQFAHLVGYAGAVSEDEVANVPDYSVSDQTGKQGIEYYFENELRGLDGLFVKFVGINGSVEEERLLREPQLGASLTLTVDDRLQSIAHEELIRALEQYGITSGAIVALDPRDGAVRALVSMPDFDPNAFSRGLDQGQADEYFTSSSRPLFNRATMGAYPAGSTIKPLLAVAALEERVIDPLQNILTNGFITVRSVFDASVAWTFLDWKNHGVVDMRDAIAVSSNVYFYTIGGGYEGREGLGIDRMTKWLDAFNWGRKLGINFDTEAPGLVPTPEWKEEKIGEQWYIGDTYNTSIGQGNVLATPLQIVSSMATLANGGTMYTPYVVSRLDRADGTSRMYFPDVVDKQVASPESITVAREGMRQAVLDGSSQQLQTLPFAFAGKTGTAEIGDGENHGLFAGFGPYENPEIAIVVLLERGEASTNAVYVARDILQRYYGGEVEVSVEAETGTEVEEVLEEAQIEEDDLSTFEGQ